MLKIILAALIGVATAIPARATESTFIKLGDRIKFEQLVWEPDVAVTFVAHSGPIITLSIQKISGGVASAPAQIDISYKKRAEIFLKRECNTQLLVCRTYYTIVTFDDINLNEVLLRYEIRVVSARSS